MRLRRVCFFLLFISIISLAGDFEEREIENGFARKAGDPQGIKVSVLEIPRRKSYLRSLPAMRKFLINTPSMVVSLEQRL